MGPDRNNLKRMLGDFTEAPEALTDPFHAAPRIERIVWPGNTGQNAPSLNFEVPDLQD
jgi:hypothetical protein